MMILSNYQNSVSTPQNVNPSIATTGSDNSSFLGMLWDTINPLQHIPIISEAYRSFTGETINPVANIAGSTIYGGPIGGAIAVASEIGHAIFGAHNDAPSQTAKETTALNLAANNVGTYKIRVTTQDWLNASFNKQGMDLLA